MNVGDDCLGSHNIQSQQDAKDTDTQQQQDKP